MILKPADIVFVMHHDNVISKIIAWFMQSRWSHCALVSGYYLDKPMLIETSDFQVTLNDLSRYMNDKNVSLEIYRYCGGPSVNIRKIIDQAYELNGTTYGYMQLVSLGFRRILKRMNIRIRNYITSGVVCTHVVTYGFKNTATCIDLDEPEQIDTEELYQLVRTSGQFELVHSQL